MTCTAPLPLRILTASALFALSTLVVYQATAIAARAICWACL